MIIFVIYGHFDTCLLKWHPKYASMEIPRKCLAMLGDNFEVMKIAVLGTPSLVNSSFACVALPDPLVVHSQEILSHFAQVISGPRWQPLSWKLQLGLCYGTTAGVSEATDGTKYSVARRVPSITAW